MSVVWLVVGRLSGQDGIRPRAGAGARAGLRATKAWSAGLSRVTGLALAGPAPELRTSEAFCECALRGGDLERRSELDRSRRGRAEGGPAGVT